VGGIIILGLFFLFLLLGVRIAISLGLSSLIYFIIFMPQVNLTTLPQRMFTAVDNSALIAIPLFILAGELMNSGGISKRLIHFATTLVGHVRSGLSMVAVLACKFFGGITGSAIADTAAIGSVLIPAMAEKGYKRSYAAALMASAGSVGPIIPPSIPMVVYGSIAGVSIGKLFMGGYVPGLLIGLSLMGTCYIIGRIQGHPKEEKASWRQRWDSFKDAILALVTPLIIMGGIVLGIVTPTEAGVIGVVYALIVGLFIYRELKFKELPKIFIDTTATTGVVVLVMATASVFGWVLAYERIPQMLAETFINFSDNQIIILALIMIIMLIMGMFLDGTAALIIMTPVFLPVINGLGIDPVYFGIMMAINICIGTLTPPVGVCLYVSSGIAKVSIEEVTREIIPFLLVIIAAMFLFILFPTIITFLPDLLMP
jgi:C4-dicarboxylate transporter, DctM subunit